MVYSANDIAKYLMKIDKKKKFLDDGLLEKNDRKFYKGNALLNKYLFFAQIFNFIKTKKILFNDNIYAYSNGPVIESVRTSYSVLKCTFDSFDDNIISANEKRFLDKLYLFLENASLDELINITHNDLIWKDKNTNYEKDKQIMDIKSNYDYYLDLYEDALYLMEKIN